MKIFKLKYLAVVLVAGLLGSCTATDNLPEAAVNAAIENGDFVMDPNMHYFVDGISTNDKDLIESKMKNAWNIHFDGSKNKIVISTTPAKFEKYKDSNIEFKTALAENDKIAIINEKNSRATNINALNVLPPDAPVEVVTGLADKSVLVACGERTILASDGVVNHHIRFVVATDADLTTVNVRRSTVRKSDGFEIENTVLTTDNFYQFSQQPTVGGPYTGRKIRLNHEGPATLIKTFYREINWLGSSVSYTVNPNTEVKIQEFGNFKSYK